MNYYIKTIPLKNLGFFLSEAYENGKSFAFAQGSTAKEAEKKLQYKLVNYYHLPLKQNGDPTTRKRLYSNSQ